MRVAYTSPKKSYSNIEKARLKSRKVYFIAASLQGNMKKYLLSVLENLRTAVQVSTIAAAIETGRLDLVEAGSKFAAFQMAMEGLQDDMVKALSMGGALGVAELKKGTLILDLKRPQVQAWVKNHTAEFVRNVSLSSQEAVKSIIMDAYITSRPPRDTAKSIKRVVGLNERQAKAVANFERNLKAKGLKASLIDKKVGKYSEKLLDYRAYTIARHESLTAVNQGRFQSWRQMQDEGLLSPVQEHQWVTSKDERVCDICEPMDGDQVLIGESFTTGLGGSVEMSPAHILCRCTTIVR